MNLIIGFLVCFAFLIMGVLLLCNKAHFLIAGFNTASKEERDMYDAKKLSTITGTFLLIMASATLNLVLGIHYMPKFKTIYTIIFISITLLSTLLVFILANTWCKKKKSTN